MNKIYNVSVVAEFYNTYEIEAESEDEANDKALEMFNENCSSDWDSFEVTAEEVIKD